MHGNAPKEANFNSKEVLKSETWWNFAFFCSSALLFLLVYFATCDGDVSHFVNWKIASFFEPFCLTD